MRGKTLDSNFEEVKSEADKNLNLDNNSELLNLNLRETKEVVPLQAINHSSPAKIK